MRRTSQMPGYGLAPGARPRTTTPLQFRKRDRQLLCAHHHLT
jgi:hypothetical protein